MKEGNNKKKKNSFLIFNFVLKKSEMIFIKDENFSFGQGF